MNNIDEVEALKKKCLEGDEEAWRRIFEMVYPVAEKIALFQFNLGEHIAADLAQEVIVKFVDHFEKVENMQAWVKRAMRNRCIDYFRKKKEISFDPQEHDYHLGEESPVQADKKELFGMLRETLSNLDERCRKILQSRFLGERSQKEVSEEVNLPYNQVPVYQSRCIKKFKFFLEKHYPQLWESLRLL